MILHNDNRTFADAIQATSGRLNILPVFIEKDYWITLVLKRLSESKFLEDVVFKGGTSLSKGYKLIDRFSEDIDIAVLDVSKLTGNKLKNLIRDVEEDISKDLQEIKDHPETSKGSRFRRTYYSFDKTIDARLYQNVSDKLAIEINSYATPFPYEKREMISLIGSGLIQNNQNDILEKYQLMPFRVNVLNKHQTLLEKLVSVFRASFEQNLLAGVSGKIRHFYDMYFLLNEKEGRAFVDSKEFSEKFSTLWAHDQSVYNEPSAWKGKYVFEAPLYLKFPEIWESLRNTYNSELSALAYTSIPSEYKIAQALSYIISMLPQKK